MELEVDELKVGDRNIDRYSTMRDYHEIEDYEAGFPEAGEPYGKFKDEIANIVNDSSMSIDDKVEQICKILFKK